MGLHLDEITAEDSLFLKSYHLSPNKVLHNISHNNTTNCGKKTNNKWSTDTVGVLIRWRYRLCKNCH